MATMIDAAGRRRHRSTKSGKQLFLCFNSRFFSSSSSMNLSSRSILSPARHRDHPLSLSASLSRRLRSDGSLKGGQSPMFPANSNASKKRSAGALDNPEPSSPKVTCIGQVRVKSKKKKNNNNNNNNNKHGRKLRNPSRRRNGGDGSFRRTDNWGSVDLSSSQSNIPENRHRNQRWVHLPLTICEGLKGLGAEISCLLPCRSSSCFSSSSERRGGCKRERSIRSNLEEMEMSNGDNKLGEEDDDEDEYEDEDEDEDEDEGRVVTVCVPPKNALLLMRCRSDPMKMAALSRRLLESPVSNADEQEDNNVQKDADLVEWCSQPNANLVAPVIGLEGDENGEAVEDEQHFDVDESGMIEELEEESEQGMEEPQEEMEDWLAVEKEEDNQRDSTTLDEEDHTHIDSTTLMEEEEEEEVIKRDDSTTMEEEDEEEKEMNEGYLSGNEDEQKFIGEEKKEEEVGSVPALSDLAIESPMEMENVEEEKAANESEEEDEEEEEEETYISLLWPEDDPAQSQREMPSSSPSPLPDCLLLMMGEPKVSMEVSKETWVCTTDFIRFLPERRRPGNKALAGVDEPEKKDHTIKIANTNASRPKPELKQAQPPRSSCSIPGKAAPVLTAQKLPRCKSEPMRTAAAKLVPPETCLWKSRKAEPLSRATVGVGSAAGVGF